MASLESEVGSAMEVEDSTSKDTKKRTAFGNRHGTEMGRSVAISAYNIFTSSSNLPPFEETTAEVFCDREHIANFAHFLMTQYVKRDRFEKAAAQPRSDAEEDEEEIRVKKLMLGTILNYVSGVMNKAKEKFSNDCPEFFKVLGGRKSEVQYNNWYNELNDQIEKAMPRRYFVFLNIVISKFAHIFLFAYFRFPEQSKKEKKFRRTPHPLIAATHAKFVVAISARGHLRQYYGDL